MSYVKRIEILPQKQLTLEAFINLTVWAPILVDKLSAQIQC